MKNSYLVVFGHDADGNPRASCFTDTDAALAMKVAHAFGYRTVHLANAELAQELPLGNVCVRGSAFLRRISRMRFERLLAAAGDHARPEAGR